jgi:hypothetical protein
MKKIFVVGLMVFVLCLGAAPQLGAQQRTLAVGGVLLRLGMDFDEVRERFQATRYELRKLAGTRSAYAVSVKGGPPFESPGNLTFRNGRLWWIGKSWGNYFGPDADAMFQAFFGILSKAGDRELTAKVRSGETREPGLIRQKISLDLSDGRSISLSVTDTKNFTRSVSIQETLGGQ